MRTLLAVTLLSLFLVSPVREAHAGRTWSRVCEILFSLSSKEPVPAQWQAPALDVRWDELTHHPVPPGTKTDGFRTSRGKLFADHKEAARHKPGLFGPIESRTVYRIDGRSPETIARSGGIFPNPSKPVGDLEFHTAGDDPVQAIQAAHAGPHVMAVTIRTTGSGSYVSFTNQPGFDGVIKTLAHELFSSRWPDRVVHAGKVNEKLLSKADWGNLRARHWPADSARDDRPTEAVFQIYQYRMVDVEGAQVTGGRFKNEDEFIGRGATARQVAEWRPVLVRVPLEYRLYRPLVGEPYYRMITPDGGPQIDAGRVVATTGPWQPFEPAR